MMVRSLVVEYVSDFPVPGALTDEVVDLFLAHGLPPESVFDGPTEDL